MINISVLEINVLELNQSLSNIRQKINHKTLLCLVAKANCYGFGVELCSFFNDKVDYFAVSSSYEFNKLKKFVTKPILILDTIYDKKVLENLIENDCELTVSNLKSLSILLELDNILSKDIKIHLAFNTGMNRFGFSDESEIRKAINKIKKSKNLKIIGVFSHFFDGKCEKSSQIQLDKFNRYCEIVDKLYPQKVIKHICASDGISFLDGTDLVRIGYAFYNNSMFDTISLKSKILEFQTLKKNDTAGYNAVFKANRKTKIAVVGIGYGDGIMRNIAKNGYVLIDDKRAKILAICMDCMLVDVSKIKCKLNDDVVIIGKCKKNKISICDIASWCDTIGYEIIVRLSNRIERIYLGENQCRLSQENTEQEN